MSDSDKQPAPGDRWTWADEPPQAMQFVRGTDKIFAAIAKAQAEISNPPKLSQVTVRSDKGSYVFDYADLPTILDAVRGPLTKNGLWFTQSVKGGALVTTLTHESGQSFESMIPFPQDDRLTSQQLGSKLTYFKRYGLGAALGIAADLDDDANSADGNQAELKARKPRGAEKAGKPTEASPQVSAPSVGARAACARVMQTLVNHGKDLGSALLPGDSGRMARNNLVAQHLGIAQDFESLTDEQYRSLSANLSTWGAS